MDATKETSTDLCSFCKGKRVLAVGEDGKAKYTLPPNCGQHQQCHREMTKRITDYMMQLIAG